MINYALSRRPRALGLPSFRPAWCTVWILADHWLYELIRFIFQILTCIANVDWFMDWLIDSWLRKSSLIFAYLPLMLILSMKRSQLLQYLDLWQLFTINKWYSWLLYSIGVIFQEKDLDVRKSWCKTSCSQVNIALFHVWFPCHGSQILIGTD